jgi:hypothetical protein
MQSAVLALLLIAGFVTAVVWFVLMGAFQARRAAALARRANETGMLFTADDPFDLPRRYADFALVSSGHSGRACNVTHGRIEGLPIRAFDFHYELGHGTRRLSRHYAVVAMETPRDLPVVLMWNQRDPAFAPLATLRSDGQAGAWSFRGDASLAGILGEGCSEAAGEGPCIETRGSTLMFAAPVRTQKDYSAGLAVAEKLLASMKNAGVLRWGGGTLHVADLSRRPDQSSDAGVETQRPA